VATKHVRIGSCEQVFAYDDGDYDSAFETSEPVKAGTPVDGNDVLRKDDMPDLAGGGPLDNSKLVDTDGAGDLDSVDDLTDYIDGTVNEIAVNDDGDGTVTIEGAGSDTDFTVVVAIQAGGAGGVGFQYKTRALTLNGGIITTVGAESGWNDI